jgi:hypothetical protein
VYIPVMWNMGTIAAHRSSSNRLSRGFFVFQKERRAVGKWETCFWFSAFPSASPSGCVECGNREAISKDCGEAQSAFHQSVISTAKSVAQAVFRAPFFEGAIVTSSRGVFPDGVRTS